MGFIHAIEEALSAELSYSYLGLKGLFLQLRCLSYDNISTNSQASISSCHALGERETYLESYCHPPLLSFCSQFFSFSTL